MTVPLLKHIYVALILIVWWGSGIPLAQAAQKYSVDLSGPGCDNADGYYLKDMDDMASVFSIPQYNSIATRDHCDVVIRADEGRRIQYLIDMIKFNECGVQIFIYDNPTIDVNPLHLIKCSDGSKPPIYGKSKFNIIRIRVRKATPQSRIFEFRMQLKNDLGPTLEYEHAKSQYVADVLEPGAIAGIGVAGAIIVIALILLAIYLCIRGRSSNMDKDGVSTYGNSSVQTSANSKVPITHGPNHHPKGKYGSTEDIRSTSLSQDKANGAYSNAAYTPGPNEKRSERSSSIGRKSGKTGFSNAAFAQDVDGRGELSFEDETSNIRGSMRQSRKDEFNTVGKKPLKSAIKKTPTEFEMNKVNTQPNGILKRQHSPNRSQTSSNEGSMDTNVMIRGYSDTGKQLPYVTHKPVLERKRSRSGTRSHRSGSSGGHGSVRGHRSRSEDKKPPKGGRMYTDVFIDDKRSRSRSSGRRAQSTGTRSHRSDRTDRTSDSLDSESSTTSHSRKVSMNPGGKRVHIKGEETDI